jgi:hypothetical protein
LLDRALDLRGNMFTGAVSDCCTGCATWHKCFNLMPRLALSLTFAALAAAYGPWGFASFLGGAASGAGEPGQRPRGGRAGSAGGGEGGRGRVVCCRPML